MLFSLLLGVGCFLVHELGHFVAASVFGVNLKWKIRRYRLVFSLNGANLCWKKKAFIGIAGFGSELAYALILTHLGLILPGIIALIHFVSYPFYAEKQYNDFNLIVG